MPTHRFKSVAYRFLKISTALGEQPTVIEGLAAGATALRFSAFFGNLEIWEMLDILEFLGILANLEKLEMYFTWMQIIINHG